MKTFNFRISEPLFEQLTSHLFPGDGDEHGAVITAGICVSGRETRLLAREIFLARDGIDYVPGKHGYRALTADFVARSSHHCAQENLCYFAVHCHGGDDFVDFSATDTDSHRRGYPALLDITNGGPVGALVFARSAVAGRIWTIRGVFSLESLTVIGQNIKRLYPSRQNSPMAVNPLYHRQSLLFGAAGQEILKTTKVGIIGLGGAGSLLNEWLAHLGVGEIIGIEFDKMEPSNQPRVVGSTPSDAQVFLSTVKWNALRKWARRLSEYKVKVAKRVAERANPGIRYRAVIDNITKLDSALLLKDSDFIFLCADSAQARLVFNALVHQYQIPGIQVGSKVPVDKETGEIGEIFAVSRPVFPYPRGGCLICNELISAAKLQEEALSEQERRQQAYVDDAHVVAPSVITLNAVASAQAANDFLLGFFGLFSERAKRGYTMQFCRDRHWTQVECKASAACPYCGPLGKSSFARGDRGALPCREK
jgi:hypothetical protein